MSEEEQDAASGGNLIEGTPGGIGGEEMRDTMMGSDDPDNEPGTSGRGFGSTGASTERRSNAGSPQPHRGLAMALQKMVEASPNTMKVELKRQSDLRDNYLDAASQKLLDEYVADPFNLRVFATMKESASTRIRLLWGLGKFVDVERTGDVPADILAFSGNVDTAGNVPAMVAHRNGRGSEDISMIWIRTRNSMLMREISLPYDHYPQLQEGALVRIVLCHVYCTSQGN